MCKAPKESNYERLFLTCGLWKWWWTWSRSGCKGLDLVDDADNLNFCPLQPISQPVQFWVNLDVLYHNSVSDVWPQTLYTWGLLCFDALQSGSDSLKLNLVQYVQLSPQWAEDSVLCMLGTALSKSLFRSFTLNVKSTQWFTNIWSYSLHNSPKVFKFLVFI